MLWSHLFKIWVYTLLVKIQIMKKLEVRTRGFSTRVVGTALFIIPLDYDNIVDERLIEELRFLQEEFEIGNFYVLETSMHASLKVFLIHAIGIAVSDRMLIQASAGSR